MTTGRIWAWAWGGALLPRSSVCYPALSQAKGCLRPGCEVGLGSAVTCQQRASYASVDQSDHGVAMGTALVYHEDMTATRLLWDE